jgi:UDP-N-acetylmuramoylalanine--D-glutamate ligase
MRDKARAAVLIGEAADEIAAAIKTDGGLNMQLRGAASMTEAVNLANDLAQPGDTVLLAPACTSYDMFADFEERGETFRMAVEAVHDSDG